MISIYGLIRFFCDIFQKFRKLCMQVYKLDTAHFYSAPNLS